MKRIVTKNKAVSGQAIVELAICLVAFLIVISGFFLITGLGIENIRNVIEAREMVDGRARDSASSNGQTIKYWDNGKDKIQFTQDDVAIHGFLLQDEFCQQFEDDETRLNLRSPAVLSCIPERNKISANLSSGSLFLSAATLASAKKEENDPLAKRNLCSLRHLIQAVYVHGSGTDTNQQSIRLEDSAFMPSSPIQAEQ